MVFQNYASSAPTVFKIYCWAEKSNLSKIDKEEQVQKVAHSLGLADLLMRKPSEIRVGKDKGSHWPGCSPAIHPFTYSTNP